VSIPSDDPILLARELGPDALCLAVGEGETVALTGGLAEDHLRCLAGADLGARGGLWIQGEALHTLKPAARLRFSHEHCAVAPRVGRLLPELTAVENTALPLLLTGLGRLEARRRALRWLERLDISEVAERRVPALTVGQARRVAIARALVSDPMILLVEEPLSGLAEGDRFQLLRILRAAQGTHSLTIMIATEDADVLAWVDRQIALPVRRRGADGLPIDAGSGGAGDDAGFTNGVAGQAAGGAIDGAAGSESGDVRGEASGDDTVGVAAREAGAGTTVAAGTAGTTGTPATTEGPTAPATHRARPGIRRAPSSLARR
jgi:putative ABC transport system ATP-binding protein